MQCTFQVGDQVVCVNAQWSKRKYEEIRPVAGRIYTIREVRLSRSPNQLNELGLLLEEIVNKPQLYNGHTAPVEVGFHVSRFRPVKKTDISVFTALLNTKDIKELIDG